MAKKLLGLFMMLFMVLWSGDHIYEAHGDPPAECVDAPGDEPDCVSCTPWYLNPAHECIGRNSPYFEQRNYLVIPWELPAELLNYRGINPDGFDCSRLLLNVDYLMENFDDRSDDDDAEYIPLDTPFLTNAEGPMPPGTSSDPEISPDPAATRWAYTCYFEIQNGRGVKFRLPLSEGCRVLNDDSSHPLEVRRVSDNCGYISCCYQPEVWCCGEGLSVVGLGDGDG